MTRLTRPTRAASIRVASIGVLALCGSLAVACAPPDAQPVQQPTGPDRATPTEDGSASGSAQQQRSVPTSSPTAPSSSTADADGAAYSTWVLGSRVLPVAADGYGEIEPTPPSLRVRRYRTTDVLPPPSDGGWHASVGPITTSIRARMGETYTAGCPVPLSGLRYLTVSFRGFDGAAHTGELVVNATQADAVVSVFHTLFRAAFPIEEMRLPTTADLDAAPTGDGNDTASFVCRLTRGSTSTFSAHAYGLAVDVDPFDNPYLDDGVVLPERASAYLDRGWERPGMVADGDLVVRAFASIGWSWGGDFSSLKDYQHFTATGR